MSDLRNFPVSDDAGIDRTRIEPSLPESSLYESSPGFEESAPLSAFHTVEEDETSNTGRIAGGLVVALMLGAAAVYGYEVSSHPTPAATQVAAKAPPATPPAQSADATPAPSSDMTSPLAMPSTAPAAAPVATPEPTKRTPVRSAHVDSGSNKAAEGSSQAASNQSAPVDNSSAQGLASVTPLATPPASAGAPERGGVQPVYPTAPSSSLANSNSAVVAPETQPSQTSQPAIQQPGPTIQPTPDQPQPAPSTPAPE